MNIIITVFIKKPIHMFNSFYVLMNVLAYLKFPQDLVSYGLNLSGKAPDDSRLFSYKRK